VLLRTKAPSMVNVPVVITSPAPPTLNCTTPPVALVCVCDVRGRGKRNQLPPHTHPKRVQAVACLTHVTNLKSSVLLIASSPST
jgi:hypothetical protein